MHFKGNNFECMPHLFACLFKLIYLRVLEFPLFVCWYNNTSLFLHGKMKIAITFKNSAAGFNFQQVPAQTKQQNRLYKCMKEERP